MTQGWRSKFGGTIYQYSGSHGCINLPVDKAKLLYEKVYKGMPVLCHN
ncbi:MAG: L,D-transpeptidase family protein [Clostridium fessum]